MKYHNIVMTHLQYVRSLQYVRTFPRPREQVFIVVVIEISAF